MKAMVLHGTGPAGPGRLRRETRDDPEPGDGEILVDVHVCGVCRTDLHVVEGDLPEEKLPIIPGHQVVGVVAESGRGARRFSAGDRVGVAWLRSTCGECSHCRARRENLCPHARFTGYHEDGGYAERLAVPEDFAYAVPEAFSDEAAAPLLCAGIIGYRALKRSRVEPGGTLGIFGFGSSAHVTHQVAVHRGCDVYVFTRSEDSRSRALKMGAVWAGGSEDEAPVKVDGAIVFAPAGPVVLPALRAIRPGGTVSVAGIHMSDIPEMSYEPHLFHEKTLTSVTANTREDGEGLLKEAAEIPIRPDVSTYPLERANEALVDLKEGRIEGTGVLTVAGG